MLQSVNSSHCVKLNLRLGWLKFINKRVFFDKSGATETQTVTSCRSSFRQKKRYMTNIKPDADEGAMTLRDTISMASGRTPQTRRTRGAKSMTLSSHGGSTNASTYHAANPNP